MLGIAIQSYTKLKKLKKTESSTVQLYFYLLWSEPDLSTHFLLGIGYGRAQ